jgi:hypothetical protein
MIRRRKSFPSMLLAVRQADRAFAEGRGPDPATRNNVGALVDDASVESEVIWNP